MFLIFSLKRCVYSVTLKNCRHASRIGGNHHEKTTVIGFKARFALIAIALAFANHSAVLAATSQAARLYSIPAGTLSEALTEFADQANIKLVFDSDLTRGFEVPAFRETVTVDQGLNKLLEDSGLSYRIAENNTTIIEPRPVVQKTEPQPAPTLPKVTVETEYGPDEMDTAILATAGTIPMKHVFMSIFRIMTLLYRMY